VSILIWKKNVIKLNSYKIILGNKTEKTLIESMFILNTTTIIMTLLQREKIILKMLNIVSVVVHVYTIYSIRTYVGFIPYGRILLTFVCIFIKKKK